MTKVQTQHSNSAKHILQIVLAVFLLFYSAEALALSFDQLMINIQGAIAPIEKMVTGAAYLIGVAFFIKALYHLKIYGELRTMMSSNTSAKEPAVYIFVGAMFIYLPTLYGIMSRSTFGTDNILAYSAISGTNSAYYGDALVTVLMLVRLVGVISFLRGWVILAKGSAHGQQPQWAKGVTHIIGGLMAINIVGTTKIFMNTLGI